MLNVLIEFIFYIIKTLSDIIITPIQLLFTNVFPDFSILIENGQSWLSDYGFRYLLFTKKALMNLIGFPQALFSILISYILVKISLHVSMQIYRFSVNIYNKFKA